MPLFPHAKFVASVADLAQLPVARGAEVAFVGRSNAGKSSAINALVGRKRLAFVSKTPGRTQLINFFDLGAERRLVDLPGYGYAAVPAPVRRRWEEVISGYLQSRANLRGIVLIMDIRHPLTLPDRQLLDWLAPTSKPVHVLLTKADKLTPAQGRAVLRDVSAALAQDYMAAGAQLFSSLRKIGIVEAEQTLRAWFNQDKVATNKKPPVKGE